MPASQQTGSSFDLSRIRAETFVRRIDFRRSLPSTNDRAVQMTLADRLETPLLVLTELQTAGRGRGRNFWWSDIGALTFSLVIDSQQFGLSARQLTQVSLSAGLAVCEALVESLPDRTIGLKWPNDVLLDGKKVCGILVEIPAVAGGRVVIGIGVNVNNSLSSAPDELRATATSFVDCTSEQRDLTGLLVSILGQLQQQLQRLGSDGFDLPTQWNRYCVLRDRTVSIQLNSRQLVGLCRGINSEAALIVETAEGCQQVYSGVVTSFE